MERRRGHRSFSRRARGTSRQGGHRADGERRRRHGASAVDLREDEPVRGTAAANGLGDAATASWPTIASTTGASPRGRTTRVSSVISAIRTLVHGERPAAVSEDARCRHLAPGRLDFRAARSPGRRAGGGGEDGCPGSSRASRSCWTAPADRDRPATRAGRRPSFTTWRAQLGSRGRRCPSLEARRGRPPRGCRRGWKVRVAGREEAPSAPR